MALSEIISGHSVCKCLQVDTQVGRDARMQPSFKLKKTAPVRMFGKGGKTIGDFVRRDMPATDHPPRARREFGTSIVPCRLGRLSPPFNSGVCPAI